MTTVAPVMELPRRCAVCGGGLGRPWEIPGDVRCSGCGAITIIGGEAKD